MPSLCNQTKKPHANAHPVLGVGQSPRKACGPLAQLLRDPRNSPSAHVLVCRGGFTIDAHATLWHQDCPAPEEARPAQRSAAKEFLL